MLVQPKKLLILIILSMVCPYPFLDSSFAFPVKYDARCTFYEGSAKAPDLYQIIDDKKCFVKFLNDSNLIIIWSDGVITKIKVRFPSVSYDDNSVDHNPTIDGFPAIGHRNKQDGTCISWSFNKFIDRTICIKY